MNTNECDVQYIYGMKIWVSRPVLVAHKWPKWKWWPEWAKIKTGEHWEEMVPKGTSYQVPGGFIVNEETFNALKQRTTPNFSSDSQPFAG